MQKEEIARLKAEQGIQSIPEPEIRTDAGEFRINGFTGGSDGSKSSEKTYRMNREEYQGLLKVASEQVPKGIYAVEKVIMRNSDVIIVPASRRSRH